VDDVEAIVSIADIGILYSLFGEGISNAIMEYMALGKPVIANDSGGTKEIVKHETNGYLITNESPRVIAGLINDLLNDKEKRIKMGEAGRKLIHESFTIDRMGKEFEKVYQEVIDK
jgi:glycosyltransferase involved in cell wall biosynthesis